MRGSRKLIGGALAATLVLGPAAPGAALLGSSATPEAEEAFADVVTYADLPGYPRTGTVGSAVRARWIERELTQAGYDVEVDRFPFAQFSPRKVGLDVGGFRPAAMPFYYSGTTSPSGITAELVDVGLGTPLDYLRADVTGRIAVIEVPSVQNALSPTFVRALEGARDAGAAAVVVSLWGPGNHIVAQNADARGGLCALPTLVVGKQDGAALRERSGQLATLTLDARYRDGEGSGSPGIAENIVATLPGQSDDLVIVGTPYNGWFTSAAERGAGLGVFLTLARHYASTGTPPPQTLKFVALGGHEVGLLGLERFIDDNPDLLDRITTYVHVGGTVAAKHYLELGDRIIATGLPEPMRSTFTSENPLLLLIAEKAFRLNPSGHLTSMAPSIQNPGEQQFMYQAGIPIVSLSGGHLFFHTPGDTPDTTSAELLTPIVAAFREVVDDLLASDRGTIRQANVLAEQFAGDTDDRGEVVHGCV